MNHKQGYYYVLTLLCSYAAKTSREDFANFIFYYCRLYQALVKYCGGNMPDSLELHTLRN